MTIQVLLATYPEFASACVGAGFILAVGLAVLDDILIAFSDALTYRHRVARCEMRSAGLLDGWCAGKQCPYRKACYFHIGVERPPTFWQKVKGYLALYRATKVK